LEVGKSSAGTVNIVTKSGTNTIHGDVFWFVRNTDLNANDFFSTSPDGQQRNQVGFTLGGPIIKNKTFFFVNFQWLRTLVTQINTNPVYTALGRQGILRSST
jgi:hypothetical protein